MVLKVCIQTDGKGGFEIVYCKKYYKYYHPNPMKPKLYSYCYRENCSSYYYGTGRFKV